MAVVINGDTFVKGIRTGDDRYKGAQVLERRINPSVRHVSAPLRWAAEGEGWDLLGFEYIPGRPADYRPGSPDLPLLVNAMTAVGETVCPEVPLPLAERRWRNFSVHPDRLSGRHLLHTDWNRSNILIAAGRAHIVDWACSTRGAAWIDAASWVVLLIAAGHTPREAEEWAARVPAWKLATPEDLDLWADSQRRLWHNVLHARTPKWVIQTAHASRLWYRYRSR
ncbi:hypothetical protein [Actinomadura gamaensis]|uniref:Aminoglycoside phosphotransferase n=1 Tax=Actinomadura gamaensis TaxID=1763541 RepID=A0ABV9TRY8_9ACTN